MVVKVPTENKLICQNSHANLRTGMSNRFLEQDHKHGRSVSEKEAYLAFVSKTASSGVNPVNPRARSQLLERLLWELS